MVNSSASSELEAAAKKGKMRTKVSEKVLKDKRENLKNGRMEVFDWSMCSASLMSSKLKLGQVATPDGVKKPDKMSNDVVKFCSYFTKKKLFGFLSANPGGYNVQDVAEFYNNARVEDGCIKSSVKDTTFSFNLKEFADIFELPHEGDADVEIDKKLLISMYLANKGNGKEVPFKYSMLRKHFNNTYSILAYIFLNIVEGSKCGTDQLTRARLSMMYHVYKDLPFNWGKYIFGRLVEDVNAFQLVEVDGLYGPVKSVGFGLKIIFILKHFNVPFSEHKALDKGKFLGEKDTLGVSKGEGRSKAKREPAGNRKIPVQQSEKVVPVKESRRFEKVVAEVEEESEDVFYDEMMNYFSRSNDKELQQTLPSRRPSLVIENTRTVKTVKVANTKLPEINVQRETKTARSNSDSTHTEDLSDNCSYNIERTKISYPVLNFTDIKRIEEFKIYVDGEILDMKIPPHYRMKYYELCNSQQAFLHEHVKGCGGLVAGIIEQTITIAEDTKAANISTSVQDLESMEKTLKSFEDLGMNVGFLRGRIIKLGKLVSEHQTVTKSKKTKLSQMEYEKTALREEKSKLEELEKKLEELTKSVRAHESSLWCFEADVDTLKKKSEELEFAIKKVVDSSW